MRDNIEFKWCLGKPSFDRKLRTDWPRNPIEPTSKVRSWTFHPKRTRFNLRNSYLSFFKMADSGIRSSFGEVSSPHITVFVSFEKITISGLTDVGTSLIGKAMVESRTMTIDQSEAPHRRLRFGDIDFADFFLPFFTKELEMGGMA